MRIGFGLEVGDLNKDCAYSYLDIADLDFESTFSTVGLHEHHGVSNHRQIDWLFVQQLVQANIKIKAPHYWTFARGIFPVIGGLIPITNGQ